MFCCWCIALGTYICIYIYSFRSFPFYLFFFGSLIGDHFEYLSCMVSILESRLIIFIEHLSHDLRYCKNKEGYRGSVFLCTSLHD